MVRAELNGLYVLAGNTMNCWLHVVSWIPSLAGRTCGLVELGLVVADDAVTCCCLARVDGSRIVPVPDHLDGETPEGLASTHSLENYQRLPQRAL